MSWYSIHLEPCPGCGAAHRLGGQWQLTDGPDRAGTVAEFATGPKLPAWAAPLIGEWVVWCDQAGDYIEADDPARVVVRPLGDRPGPFA
jgi:hypothetical protein